MGRGFLGWDAFRPDGGSVFQVLPLVHGVPWGPGPPRATPMEVLRRSEPGGLAP